MAPERFDVVCLGGGPAGSLTALALARSGLRVLVVERMTHPRFAIGESIVPTTTLQIDAIADRYRIPELHSLTRATPWPRPPLGAFHPKYHFWFGLHQEGRELRPSDELLFETLDPPNGPDCHLDRAAIDAYLVGLLPRYGVGFADRTKLVDLERGDGGVTTLFLRPTGQPIRSVEARLVVDATGPVSLLGKRLGHFETGPLPLKTNTRSIYGHFSSRAMPELDDLMGGPCPLYRTRRSAGTMHHCFRGGWIWVIPLGGDTVSVGVVLDRRIHPEDRSKSARQEFDEAIARFPTVARQVAHLEPTRPLVRRRRLQTFNRSLLGPGIVLTPHATAFIDPLFSSGLLQTATFVRNLVPLVREAAADDDYDPERFRPLEENFYRDLFHLDTIVAGVIESFRDRDVFRQFWRAWIAASIYQAMYNSLRHDAIHPAMCGLYGANRDDFRADVQSMWGLLSAGSPDETTTALGLKEIADRHWEFTRGHPMEGVLERVGSPHPYKVMYKAALFNTLRSARNRFLFDLVRRERRLGHLRLGRVLAAFARTALLLLRLDLRRRFGRRDEARRRHEEALVAFRLPWFDDQHLA